MPTTKRGDEHRHQPVAGARRPAAALGRRASAEKMHSTKNPPRLYAPPIQRFPASRWVNAAARPSRSVASENSVEPKRSVAS